MRQYTCQTDIVVVPVYEDSSQQVLYLPKPIRGYPSYSIDLSYESRTPWHPDASHDQRILRTLPLNLTILTSTSLLHNHMEWIQNFIDITLANVISLAKCDCPTFSQLDPTLMTKHKRNGSWNNASRNNRTKRARPKFGSDPNRIPNIRGLRGRGTRCSECDKSWERAVLSVATKSSAPCLAPGHVTAYV